MLPHPKEANYVAPPERILPVEQTKPSLFKSLDLSAEQHDIVTDIIPNESKPVNAVDDVDMPDSNETPTSKPDGDVEMATSETLHKDEDDEDMETSSNLNQSRISDFYHSKNWIS